ncbi:EcsC family protein [bacterium]|nr:EcsC family protein [bacterium]
MAKEIMTESKMMKIIDAIYEKALNGLPGFDSATELAKCYLREEGTLEDRINSLIRWQNVKAGTSGFLNGLGGVLTLPITIPVNISSVLYVQIRMSAAIAYMCGYDLKDDRVKTFVYASLLGKSAVDVLKTVGINIGNKVAIEFIKSISKETVVAINKKVGFRLLTKFGEKGFINLWKIVPLIGGLIGLIFDATATNIVGNCARDIFIKNAKYIENR